MKKLTLIFIALALGTMLLGLSGCGKKQTSPAPVGLANPMTELTQEEFEQNGFGFAAPEGAEDVKFFTIATDPMTYQMSFSLEGSKYSVRVQPTAIVDESQLPDISGLHYEWENREQEKLGYCNAFLYWNEGEAGHITWLDVVPGLLYDVSVDTGAAKVSLLSVASRCCPPVQGDVG